jgi:hypothetical protein
MEVKLVEVSSWKLVAPLAFALNERAVKNGNICLKKYSQCG